MGHNQQRHDPCRTYLPQFSFGRQRRSGLSPDRYRSYPGIGFFAVEDDKVMIDEQS